MNEKKIVMCLNCGHKQNVSGKTSKDDLGKYTICDKCSSSFDVWLN